MTRLVSTGVRALRITEHDSGQRIDNYLARVLKDVPKSHLYRILRRGEVRVNSARVKPDYRVRHGDSVRIPPVAARAVSVPSVPEAGVARIKERVIYRDDAVLVLDKPSGLAVHSGSGQRYGVIDLLRAAYPEADFLELVHRLDRDTSGCLLCALRRDALTALHAAFKQGTLDKRYLTLVAGRCGVRRVELALGPGEGAYKIKVSDTGRAALTQFTPQTYYRGYTLVEACIATGRTHQIRVHAAAIGHPVAGDDRYGDWAANKRLAALGLRRVFLHAQSLSLTLPWSGRELAVTAPPPFELTAVLDRLEVMSE